MGGYSCSLSAHDGNVLGQCAQLSVHSSGLCGKKVRGERKRLSRCSLLAVRPRGILQERDYGRWPVMRAVDHPPRCFSE